MSPELKKHLTDFVKGLLAAMATSACLAAMNYFGAHVGEITSFAASTAAATGTIKALK